ncbi:MAG: NAD-dependent epimerase/dehydratase family protein [Candidatus Promineifilaceae bacterium]|nr:NAD-dependent epimerase/dehydratase family protein [Candidatus Promineifilaceae bacterium]
MKAFVTGGTGFLGHHVVRKLVERDYEVYALTRSKQGEAELHSLGAIPVHGDINDPDSMREAMQDSDVVFHVAGWYKIGSDEWMEAEAINVAGTRSVLGLAWDLGVPKIIHTSTVAVYGDTKGELVDENYFQGGPFLSEYDRTKWLAHYKVAQPMIERGAPIIIVAPGGVYGPGDHMMTIDLMELFYAGKLPAVPAPGFTWTYAHVEDIAEGLILAAEKGEIGETYILAGPAIPLGEMVDFWGQITGRKAPLLRVPASILQAFKPIVSALETIVPLPEFVSSEAIDVLNATYMARADKARVELDWHPRSLQEGMSETFRWIAARRPAEAAAESERQRKIAAYALLATATVLLLWFLGRRRTD